jgi:hypothetical protein
LNVHQDDVEAISFPPGYGFTAVTGDGDTVSPLAQQLDHQLLIDRIVFSNQDV